MDEDIAPVSKPAPGVQPYRSPFLHSVDQQKAALWGYANPSLQSSVPNQGAQNIGAHLWRPNPQPVQDFSQTRFYQSYQNGEAAKRDYDKVLRASVKSTGGAASGGASGAKEEPAASGPGAPCTVYPPLLVRAAVPEDRFIPVVIQEDAFIHKTARVPDLVIGFHRDSGAIIPTVCRLSEAKEGDMKTVFTILYSIVSDTPVNVRTFQELYDRQREEVIRFVNEDSVV